MKVTRGASHWPLKCYFRDQQRWGTGSRQGAACIWLCRPPAPPRGCHQPGSSTGSGPGTGTDTAAPSVGAWQGFPGGHQRGRQQRPGPRPRSLRELGEAGDCPRAGVDTAGPWTAGADPTRPQPAWTQGSAAGPRQQAPTRRLAQSATQPTTTVQLGAPGQAPGQSGIRDLAGPPVAGGARDEVHRWVLKDARTGPSRVPGPRTSPPAMRAQRRERARPDHCAVRVSVAR